MGTERNDVEAAMGLGGRILKWAVLLGAAAGGTVPTCPAQEAGWAGTWGELAGEPLVPAVLGLWTDQTGSAWNVQEHGTLGRIGSGMINVGQALWIGGEAFTCAEPLMTRSGGEWVFPADRLLAGLSVTRRVRLDLEAGTVRYLEVLRNISVAEIVVAVEIRHQYNGNHAELRTDQGRLSPMELEREEAGLVVVPASETHPRRLVHALRERGGEALVPVVSAPSRFAMHVRYEVRVPPGRTVSLLHGMAQALPVANQGAEFPVPDLASWMEGVEGTGAGEILTVARRGPGMTPWKRFLQVLEREAAERPAADIWCPDEESRVPGTVEGGPVILVTARGRWEIPVEQIAEIEGTGNGRRDTVQVTRRDGEIRVGRWEASPTLRFRATSGSDAVSLGEGTFERLFRGRGAGDVPGAESAGTGGYVETQEGERFAVGTWADGETVAFASALGEWRGRWEDVAGFTWEDGDPWLELRDGSRWRAFPGAETWDFRGIDGTVWSISPREVRHYAGRDTVPRRPPEPVPVQVRLQDGGRLAGRWSEGELPFVLASGRLAVSGEKIRSVQRVPGVGTVRIALDDGGTFQGKPERPVERLAVAGGTLAFAWADVREVRVQPSGWSDAERAEVTADVARLGAERWEDRERASEALARRGPRIHGLLEAALGSATDAEIRHRIHLLLDPEDSSR